MRAVFSQRSAMRLKRLSLPTACSMRAALCRGFREEAGLSGTVARCGITGQMPRLRAPSRLDLAVVTFVGDGGARQNIGSDVEQEFEVAAVAGFAPVRWKASGKPSRSTLRWILVRSRHANGRAPDRLAPLCPAAETWAHATVKSNVCAESALSLSAASASKRPQRCRLGSPPEAFPDRIPMADLRRKGAAGDVVNRRIMQRLQKLPVVPYFVATARAHRPENLRTIAQPSSVIAVSMVGPPKNRPTMNH